MARYVYRLKAFSPRDGGWVLWFRQFRTREAAWVWAIKMWDLAVLSGDYITLDVVRTVAFSFDFQPLPVHIQPQADPATGG